MVLGYLIFRICCKSLKAIFLAIPSPLNIFEAKRLARKKWTEFEIIETSKTRHTLKQIVQIFRLHLANMLYTLILCKT